MPKTTADILKIAVYGVPGLLDYLPPKGMQLADCAPGKRALIEVGTRLRIGLIMKQAPSDWPLEKVKSCKEIPDAVPLIDDKMLKLLSWCSSYYLCDAGTVMHTLLPKKIREATAEDLATHWELDSKRLRHSCDKLTPTQQKAIAMFEEHQGVLTRHQLATINPGTRKKLQRSNLIYPTEYPIPAYKELQPGNAILLNQEQRTAAASIVATPGFNCTLLYGVTGSGKTQVYLELVRRVLLDGKQAIVLVPEIGLTPQTLARFAKHFAGAIAVVHSALSERERANTWHSAKNGQAQLIIGTRSAIFSPCNNLGLIIVDEEHDGSFKQQSSFSYNARDLAIVRAQMHNCPVVLGSATPQLSTLHRVARKQFRQVRFNQRATNIPMPTIEIIDMRGIPARSYLAPVSLAAISKQLARDKQVLVFLNRRGFAPLIHCHNCGWQAVCCNCDSRMTLHQHPSGLLCHHCGDRQPIPHNCPKCGNKRLQSMGSGTQHIAGYLQREFPTTPVLRIDRDSVGSTGKFAQTMLHLNQRQARLLVGTQMLAKGHDFAHLGLVVVLEADNGLFSSDFRAPEVTLQLLIQVAGRAGRTSEQGQVLIQTTQPRANYFRHLEATNYDDLAELLLQERHQYQLPPYNSLVLMRARNRNQQRLRDFMQQAERRLNNLAIGTTHLRIYGPAPPAQGKLAGVWQEQILLFHPKRAILHQLCQAWYRELGTIRPASQWFFDVDPYAVV